MFLPVSLTPMFLDIPLFYVSFIGPLDTVPWNNRFKCLVLCLTETLFQHLASAAGAIPGEHPVEPRTSIRKPVYRAIIQALRFMDSMTDLSFIVELVTEVWLCSGPWVACVIVCG